MLRIAITAGETTQRPTQSTFEVWGCGRFAGLSANACVCPWVVRVGGTIKRPTQSTFEVWWCGRFSGMLDNACVRPWVVRVGGTTGRPTWSTFKVWGCSIWLTTRLEIAPRRSLIL
eukprot:365469-Chlamydomonas_euryale.AAC.12